MSKIVLPIGSINLVVEGKAKKIEIAVDEQLDLITLLTNLTHNKTIPSVGLCSFQDYFEKKVMDLDLPLTAYRQKNYYAFKPSYSSGSLCYYNSNDRVKYLNVSFKEAVFGCLFKRAPKVSDSEEYYWVGSSYNQYVEESARLTQSQLKDLLSTYTTNRQVIPVDIDTRFRGTKRVRLYTTREVDSLIEAITPILTEHLTLDN
jgi:hypothetical protein